MRKAFLSLKKSCSLVLKPRHICIGFVCVAIVALIVNLAAPQNVVQQSRFHTSALLSYVGFTSGQQQDPVFRVFPVNTTQVKGVLKSIYNNCLADEAQLLQGTKNQRQRYRVEPLQELSQLLPSRGCTLHGLLQHCPVSRRRRHVVRSSRHMLRDDAKSSQPASLDQPAVRDIAGSILQKHSGLFQPHITTDMVLRALQRGFVNETLVSPYMYKQATRNGGDPTRLQHFFRRLLRGELVKVVAVGGSVTTGMGAHSANESYVQRIHAWLRSLGTEDHPLQIEFTNSAVSATTSSYTSQCVADFVPEDANLVLVEFSVNDWETVDPTTFTWMDNSLRRGFERLLRKLLKLRSEPALLVLHWWAPLYFQSSFWNVAEDELDTIASYYRLQSISFRNAFYSHIMTDQPGFRLEDIFCDVVHPNAVGHRLFAELVVLQLQELLAGLLLAPSAHSDTWLQAMPPPLFRGNEATGQAVCLKGNALLSAVVSTKGGWKWVNEAREGAQQAKWGMVSTQPGDELLMRIDHSSRRPPAKGQAGEANSNVVVGLGLLKSYQDVGAALVGCSGGCSCNHTRFELLHEQQVSQVYWFYLFLTMLPHKTVAQECHMSVTVKPAFVPNGASKVKVTSLMVSEDDRAENRKMFTVLETTDAEGNNSG